MPASRRKLSEGVRWRFQGSFHGEKYSSKAIYLTKADCLKAERDFIKEKEKRQKLLNPNMELKALINERLDEVKAKRTIKYYSDTKFYLKLFYKKIGNKKAIDVRKAEIVKFLQEYSKELEREGSTNYMVNSALRAIKALFGYACDTLEVCDTNPCRGIKPYPIRKKTKYVPPEADIAKVRSIMTPEQRELFDFIAETGARLGEALRATSEDVKGDRIVLWTKKAKNSDVTPRFVPAPECVKEKKGRLFPYEGDHPCFLTRKCKVAKVTPFNWHSMRHRRASIWAKEKTVAELMLLLGHSSPTITARYLQQIG